MLRNIAKVSNGALIGGVLVASLVGCGGSPTPVSTSTVTATSMVTVTQSSSPPVSSSRPSSTESTPPQTSSQVGMPTESWTMPNEIGKNLQRAQDDMQALTGNPMFVSTSEDLTGKGRQQILDRNWQVCSSSPPPGGVFTSQTNVVFGVVRDSERCP